MTEILKSCPFCGGKAEYDDNEAAFYGFDTPGVECTVCGVRNFEASMESAIKNWNKRI